MSGFNQIHNHSLFLFILSMFSCSDASLYHSKKAPLSADRVAIEGRVCTEDPAQNRFPARLIIVADQAQGPLYSEFDPGQKRLQMLNSLIQNVLSKPEYSVAIIGYAGRVQRLAPDEELFTRNPGVLINAVSRLSLPESCIGNELCRDYRSGLDMAKTLIEDDLASMEAGQRAVTQYTILWLGSGQQSPLAQNRDCCPRADRSCRNAEGSRRPSLACQTQLDIDLVQDLRTQSLAMGAGGVQLHIMHLAAEEQDINQAMSQLFEQLTFAGGGRYARFSTANNLDPRAVSIFDRPSDMEAAQILVVNQSAAPRLGGILADSDQDGLADEEEDLNGNGEVDEGESDPRLKDSDGDGIGDMIEARVGFVNGEIDQPIVCDDLFMFEGLLELDRDFDGLNECEERLMGTSPSLSDSDGDNLPDGLEVIRGTDHLNADSAEDFDEDGVSNGDELKEGTDPRSIDESQRLGLAARYDVEREGRVKELKADPLLQIEGIQVFKISNDLQAGLGAFDWTPSPDTDEQIGFLRFKAPSEDAFGEAIAVKQAGRYTLYGNIIDTQLDESVDDQGEADRVIAEPSGQDSASQDAADLWIELEINPMSLPDIKFVEDFLIRQRERSCLSFTARNIRLVETMPLDRDQRLGRQVGANEITVYFSQKPARQSEVPGRFRVARVPIYYQAPDQRNPSGAKLTVEEGIFVSPSIESNPIVQGDAL
ncbi:MAG: hypothetical protein CMH49_04615 [Myxococcales bacterium]|nr:hypothetical protein [Myxococcales bacterium]